MKNLENYEVQELNFEEVLKVEGGSFPDNYNRVLGVLLWPFYDVGYLLGRI